MDPEEVEAEVVVVSVGCAHSGAVVPVALPAHALGDACGSLRRLVAEAFGTTEGSQIVLCSMVPLQATP